MDYSYFKENLKRLIDSRAMTTKDLSEDMNITPATLSRYLSGNRKPDLPYVVRIAEYFNVSIDWLLGISGDKFEVLPKDIQEVVELYSLATSDDRAVVQAVLNKYRGVR